MSLVYRILALFLCAVSASLTPFCAAAKSQENLPVYDRIQPGFENPAIRLGDFLLQPSVQLIEVFDNNIYATKDNTKSDLISILAPILTIDTSNRERGFKAKMSSIHSFYKKYDDENTNDFFAAMEPYWVISKALKVTGKLGWEQNHEQRSDESANSTSGAEEPTTYQRSIGRLGWEYKRGKAGMSMFGQSVYYDFDNVVRVGGSQSFINDDRSRYENELGGELSCDITDQSNLYWATKWFNRDYKHREFDTASQSYTGQNRDSKGYQSVVGLRFPITGITLFDGQAGYHSQDFDDPAFKNVDALVAKAKLVWMVTPLTTIDLTSERQVYETVQTGASAYAQTQVAVHVYHELRRNVVLDAGLDTGTNDYIGNGRKDNYVGTQFGATYKMNRALFWHAAYAYDNRNSTDSSAEYRKHQIFLSAQVQF